MNYPNSPEGKKAEDMMQSVMPLLANKEFEDSVLASNFKAIYQFTDSEKEELDEFVKTLDETWKEIRHFDLTASKDVYSQNTVFVVVHGFNTLSGALGFSDMLKANKQQIDKEYFSISSPNYQIIQIHKNLEDYLKYQ